MIVGRNAEIKILDKLYKSDSPQFVGVYGRSRVGKTYLIKTFFRKQMTFYHTGINGVNNTIQLEHFIDTINELAASHGLPMKSSSKWLTAFKHLAKTLDEIGFKSKQVIFIDEIAWMDAPNSNFMAGLEYFWNSWASDRKIMFIVCGSATSWMLSKLVNNYGGLYNRLTYPMKIEPFKLYDVEKYFHYKKITTTRLELIEYYMILGGIPFYLDKITSGLSVSQNINEIFFRYGASLKHEFKALYTSIFRSPQKYMSVVEALSKKLKGLTREALLQTSKLPNGGSTSQILSDLEECGIIRKYYEIGKVNKNHVYQLIDPFTLFHFNFLKSKSSLQWNKIVDHPIYRTWTGYAFEILCMCHIGHIEHALGIAGVISNAGCWQNKDAQIDLLIERRDRVINLVEMKYSINKLKLGKNIADSINKKMTVFKDALNVTDAIHPIVISNQNIEKGKAAHLVLHVFDHSIFFVDL